MTDTLGKKRPRVDLLASLDAAFAAKKDTPASKYTAQAAAKEAEVNSQQAYLHTKRKKKGSKAQQHGKGNNHQKPSNPQQQQGKGGNASGDVKANGGGSNNDTNARQQQPSDPLYGKLNVDILRVGLKNCSLLPQAKMLNKLYVLNVTLKSYLEMVNQGSNAGAASDKLKNKVLQLDNPIKTSDAKKNALNYAQAQSAKLLSARQRRKLGLHLLKGEMKFSDAEQLCTIWRRYARDVIGADSDDPADEVTRNARAQSKFKTLDLSGCPVEVVRSRNPCAIGSSGIVVAEKQQVLQICTPADKIISMSPPVSSSKSVVASERGAIVSQEIGETDQLTPICDLRGALHNRRCAILAFQFSVLRTRRKAMQAAAGAAGVNGAAGAVTPVRTMRPGNIESESEDLAAPKQSRGGRFHPGAASSSSPTVPKQHAPASSSSSSALRSLHTEHFEPPRPSLVQVIITLIAYFLLITDIPRAGSSVDELPYKQIEPNVYSMYGPTILPTMTLVRAFDAADPTKSTISSPTNSDGVPTTSFKFETSSYGLRSILAERVDSMTWPRCMTNYDDACDNVLALDLVFEMLENLVGTIVDNAGNTTSYKSMSDLTQSTLGAQYSSLNGSTVITREYLSTLPQRVRFAIRTKARWIDGASNFLSHYILDQKYWMSTWATVFDDFNVSNPGMDICLDDLDRPLFCEKSWADFNRLAPDGSPGAAIGKIWDDISDKAAALQLLHPTKTLDMTIIETETDPLTLLGGAVVLAHKLYNVVVVYRVRDCAQVVDPVNATSTITECNTLELHDVRYEGSVLYTDAIEWRYITKIMRYFAQIYSIVRLLGLGVACYAAVRATKEAPSLDFVGRIKVALRILFAIPSQAVVYGSFIPVFVYAAAHVIDGVILYQINDGKMHSFDEFFSNRFGDMVELVSVRMRSVWVIAIIARMFVFIQTSGGWTPAKGVSGIKGFLLSFISCIAVVFVLRSSSLQDSRILETNEVEPAATFMYIRAETLDTWKMNAFGLYNDFLSLGLTSIAYIVALAMIQLVRRCYCKRDTSKESLSFASSDVLYSAGFLWDPSCLVVCWGNEIHTPVLRLLAPSTLGPISIMQSANRTSSTGLARRGSNVVTKEVENRYVLMNIAFLSDPWNFLTMKFGHTRIHLFELLSLERKLLHPYSKARFLREYEMKSDDLALLGTFNVSELEWEQVITCR